MRVCSREDWNFIKGLSLNWNTTPSVTMKTAVTVLQELMVKLGQTPEYDCIAQSGPQHLSMFEYRCRARGIGVTATARSKKEGKQEAARLMLLALSARGELVPPPYNLATMATSVTQKTRPEPVCSTSIASGSVPCDAPVQLSHSYVALLNDLCIVYRLPGVEYELVADTGPPHMRQFSVRARIGQHTRLATATTKKSARQQAAEQLFKYMRENLSRLTKDFVEEEAIARHHERVMERYTEAKEEMPWRPNLGQKIAEYHRALHCQIDASKCELALKKLEESPTEEEGLLDKVVALLGLKLARSEVPSESNTLCMVELEQTSPALKFMGHGQQDADDNALQYLRMALAPEQASFF